MFCIYIHISSYLYVIVLYLARIVAVKMFDWHTLALDSHFIIYTVSQTHRLTQCNGPAEDEQMCLSTFCTHFLLCHFIYYFSHFESLNVCI